MNVIIDGVEYAPVKANGSRVVMVVDRGWIFAGDVTRENGRITLSRAVWVFRWESCGFSKVIENPGLADIRPISNVEIPDGSEIFCIPVSGDWGL